MKLTDLPTASFCILPWVGAAVGPDGAVVPCCLHIGDHAGDYAKEHHVRLPAINNGVVNARDSFLFKKIREQMIAGEKPSICKQCWSEEAKSNTVEFQRIWHHHAYADKDVTKYKNEPLPLRFLETGISNLCNFACVMCNKSASSIIYAAFHPGEKIPKGFHKDNETIDDDLSKLTLVKIIGGEPMIEKKHDKLLEKIVNQNINPSQLVIEYHTNASVFPSQRVIDCWKKLSKVRIIFSMDGVGEESTLQRPGNYKWEDVEATVDKYIQLANTGVPIVFSANIVLTALNIDHITDTCEWLYNKLKHNNTSWFYCQPIREEDPFTYIDFRNLSKQTKQRIKDKWKKWEDSNPPVLTSDDHDISNIYQIAKKHIDEKGTLATPLTVELMLEKHPNARLWKMFDVDLSRLNI